MTIVERTIESKFPSFVWAKDIKVRALGEEIEVSGVIPIAEDDRHAAPDSLRAYRHAISRYGGAKRQGRNSPHVQFANANDVQKQVTFLGRYGPMIISSLQKEERDRQLEGPFDFRLEETFLVARQNLSELMKDQLVYRSALFLIFELQKGKQSDIATVRRCISTIVDNVSGWPRQWERERRLRSDGLGYAPEPHWNFTQQNLEHLELWRWEAEAEPSGDPWKDAFRGLDPVRDGHCVICELVNAFVPLVYPWGKSPVEAPHWDIVAGIRPLLYYMLRREYLSSGGISICRHSDCRNVFEIERSGQEFCDEDCSRLQRQREYWSNRGSRLRKLRLAKRKATPVARKTKGREVE
jgi:hypothetical protein